MRLWDESRNFRSANIEIRRKRAVVALEATAADILYCDVTNFVWLCVVDAWMESKCKWMSVPATISNRQNTHLFAKSKCISFSLFRQVTTWIWNRRWRRWMATERRLKAMEWLRMRWHRAITISIRMPISAFTRRCWRTKFAHWPTGMPCITISISSKER